MTSSPGLRLRSDIKTALDDLRIECERILEAHNTLRIPCVKISRSTVNRFLNSPEGVGLESFRSLCETVSLLTHWQLTYWDYCSADARDQLPADCHTVAWNSLFWDLNNQVVHRYLGAEPKDAAFPTSTVRVVASAAQPSGSQIPAGNNPVPNVPFRKNEFFTGRVQWLERLFTSATRRSTPLLAISGLGGIGKTQLALEFTYRYACHFSHVLWLPAGSAIDLQCGIVNIADKLKLSFNPGRADTAVDALKAWMEVSTDWLLVLDNADHPTLIEPFLPRRIAGHILLTSRDHFFDKLGPTEVFAITEFSPEETTAFLCLRTKRSALDEPEQNAVVELHRELGGLPLALEQAAAYIAEKQVATFAFYLSEFRHQRLKLLNKQMPEVGNYPHSVATTWLLNFSAIKRLSTSAADLLRFTAFLKDSQPIPFSYVMEAEHSLPPSLRMLLAASNNKILAVAEALAPLARFSLVRVEPAAQAFTMHPLVQEIVRDLDDT